MRVANSRAGVLLSAFLVATSFTSTTLAATTNPGPSVTPTPAPPSTSDSSISSPAAPLPNLSSSSSAAVSMPPISSPTTSADAGLGTNAPPIPNGALPIPTAVVPDTQMAQYMQVSTLPNGTVFIVVGAFLGFLAAIVIAWRVVIAWTLHRSVKKAALWQDKVDQKALFRTPAAPMYKYSDRESTASFPKLGAAKGKGPKPQTGNLPAANQSSLFFSPTAGAASNPNRASSYLPSGYYAAGASAPGNGAGMTHIGSGSGIRESINMSNLAPQIHGYSRARSVGPSPPESPAMTPQYRGLHNHNLSSSTLDLGRLPNGRAPSAVLDEFFDEPRNASPYDGQARR